MSSIAPFFKGPDTVPMKTDFVLITHDITSCDAQREAWLSSAWAAMRKYQTGGGGGEGGGGSACLASRNLLSHSALGSKSKT